MQTNTLHLLKNLNKIFSFDPDLNFFHLCTAHLGNLLRAISCNQKMLVTSKPCVSFTHRVKRPKVQLSSIKWIYFILHPNPEIFIKKTIKPKVPWGQGLGLFSTLLNPQHPVYVWHTSDSHCSFAYRLTESSTEFPEYFKL